MQDHRPVMAYNRDGAFQDKSRSRIAGMFADRRRTGRIHPAWLWGFGVLVLTGVTTETLGRSGMAGSGARNHDG